MVEWKVRLAKSARVDIVGVVDYIDNVLKNPSAADDLIECFVQQTVNLKQFPEFAPLVGDSRFFKNNIRYFPIKNYMVFYYIDESSRTVNILRFLHGSRDWQSML